MGRSMLRPYKVARRLFSAVVSDCETFREACIEVGAFFTDFADGRKTRTAFEHGAKLRELPQRARRENFDAAVTQIANVPGEMELFRGVLREIAKTDTLYAAGDEEPLGLWRVAHGQEIVAETGNGPRIPDANTNCESKDSPLQNAASCHTDSLATFAGALEAMRDTALDWQGEAT